MILNLTQHKATNEQVQAGVVDLPEDLREVLIDLLTFNSLPSEEEIDYRAEKIVALVNVSIRINGSTFTSLFYQAMIGGAPYLMAPLELALQLNHIDPLYAFSVRESIEETKLDGTVKKVNIFRHAGFVGMK